MISFVTTELVSMLTLGTITLAATTLILSLTPNTNIGIGAGTPRGKNWWETPDMISLLELTPHERAKICRARLANKSYTRRQPWFTGWQKFIVMVTTR